MVPATSEPGAAMDFWRNGPHGTVEGQSTLPSAGAGAGARKPGLARPASEGACARIPLLGPAFVWLYYALQCGRVGDFLTNPRVMG